MIVKMSKDLDGNSKGVPLARRHDDSQLSWFLIVVSRD